MIKIIRFFLASIIILSFLLQPLNVNADAQTLGDLEDNLAALKKKKADNEANQKYTEIQIKEREQAIQDAELEISIAKGSIIEAQEKIEESNIKIEELKLESEKLLQFSQQMQSSNAYLEYISGASTTTEMIMRIAAINQITDYNQKSLDNLEKLIKENEQLKIDLVKRQEELIEQNKKYETTIIKLTGSLEEYDKFALDINTQIKVAQDQYNTYSKLCKNNPKTSNLGRAAKLTDCSNTAYNAGWLKPLVSGGVTSALGWRNGVYAGNHNGIDIGNNKEGTSVYAAAAGVVSGIIERYWCGGNMVYIDVNVGGQMYTTYYYHLLKINVKLGQSVTAETVIGTVGGGTTKSYDSCTSGAHLHYGVAKGSFTGSISSKNVIIPPGFKNVYAYKWTSRYDYYSS